VVLAPPGISDRALLAISDSRAISISNFVISLSPHRLHRRLQIMGNDRFILGVSLSSLAGHLVIELALHIRGIDIVAQDLRYTLAAASLGVLGVLGVHYIAPHLPANSRRIFEFLWPALIFTCVSAWAAFYVLRQFAKNKK